MSTSKISVFLRGATDELTKVLRENGFLQVTPERESELTILLEKFNEEMYGAPTSGSSPRRPKQTDVRVVTDAPVTYDRDYLTKQSVQELLRIAKAKGCKNLGPRKKESLIEKLLVHLATPHAAAEQVNSEVSSQASDITDVTNPPTDDELRPEPVPVPTEAAKEKKPRKKKNSDEAEVPTEAAAAAPAKKGRKKKETSDDESKPKTERKKKVKDPAPAAEPEKEEEITIAVRSWIHPKEHDKPPTERTRYCIDPITNNIYNPEQLTDEPIGRWDEEAQEIIPF